MARRTRSVTPTWVLVPCAIVGVALGFIAAASRRRRTITACNTSGFAGDATGEIGDVVRTETPHPTWTAGQKQPPPEGLDIGE